MIRSRSSARSRFATAASGRSISTSADAPLLCRHCAIPQVDDERFCRSCGRPLVLAEGEAAEPDEFARRARKVHPRLARGEAQQVAVVANSSEGELVQGILLEEGIPSYLRRSGGFDVPDFLAAGPRDVMVPASAVETARALLAPEGEEPGGPPEPQDPARVVFRFAAVFLIALLIFSVIAGVLFALTS
jgi:hypothetical protein